MGSAADSNVCQKGETMKTYTIHAVIDDDSNITLNRTFSAGITSMEIVGILELEKKRIIDSMCISMESDCKEQEVH